jgi:cyclopropane fatty-acyl-phospholipid synthase-like methyltransferase
MNFKTIIKKSAIKNHSRNRKNRLIPPASDNMVIEILKKNNIKPKSVLEIGCSTGYILEKIRLLFKSKCYGVDISSTAISEGRKLFKKLKLENNFFEDSLFNKKKYDVIICGFFLFMMPLDKILNFFSKVDASLNLNSYIIINDFVNLKFIKKKYKHDKGLFVYRWDYKKLLLSMPNYKLCGVIKRYRPVVKDFEEVAIIKKIKV